MKADDEKMFLENIEEFVMDENKIVTYKWLSQTLNLHVNTAKQLLYKYATSNEGKEKNVYMTYLISGVLQDGPGIKIQVVRETDVDKVKSQFKLITSEHIYSVQKSHNMPDLNILYAVEKVPNETSNEDVPRLGVIRCKKAIQRLGDDIAMLQNRARAAAAVESSKPVFNAKKVQSKSDKPIAEKATAETAVDSKPCESETVKSDAKPNGIASMFAAQSSKNPSHKVSSVAGNNASKKTKGGIAMFFSKQAEKPSVKTSTSTESEVDEVKAVTSDGTSSNKLNDVAKVVDEPKPKKDESQTELTSKCNGIKGKDKLKMPVKSKSQGENKENAKNKRKASVKGRKEKMQEDLHHKKRRRIMIMSDSSSSDDDMFGRDESDSEVRPPSPEIMPEEPVKSQSSDEDVIPSTPVSQQALCGKARKRKLVNKTFEDKDGFIMTKKEYVFESCSEDESDNKEKKLVQNTTEEKPELKDPVLVVESKPDENTSNGEKRPKKKKASPVSQKSKQSTLMSFFNKK